MLAAYPQTGEFLADSRLHLVAMDVNAPVFNGIGDPHARVRVGLSGVSLGGRL